MLALAVTGSVLIVGGLLVCRAASRAGNDVAWSLYGCLPIGIGLALIAIVFLGKVL